MAGESSEHMTTPQGAMRARTSVSIEFMFRELPVEERVAAAAQAGFDGIELWDWRDKDMDRLAAEAARWGVEITGFFGNRLHSLLDPAQQEQNLAGLVESIAVAKRVGCRALHAFVQEIRPDGSLAPLHGRLSEAEAFDLAVAGLRKAADLCQHHDLLFLLEAINPVSVPGYYLGTAEQCLRVVEAVGHPNLVMMYDFFHQQQAGGNLITTLERCLHRVVAVHVADVPGRHEPGTGEINFASLNRHLDDLGFGGLIVFEVRPKRTSAEAVAAIKAVFGDRFTR